MKKVLFKDTTMLDADSRQVVTYKEMLLASLNETPTNDEGRQIPMGYQEIAKRVRCIDALSKAIKNKQDYVELEDEDFKTVTRAVEFKKWMQPHKDIVDFVEYIKSGGEKDIIKE